MSNGEILEFAGVTKRFGTLTAVSNFSARIEPGVVTGFLGPNGAGKTTSLRVLLGLTHASEGSATIGGKRYTELRQPLRHVGSVLEASELRPRRTAARQLELTARQNQIPSGRVADVLNFVGLGDEADARVSSYSLGMKQRLAIATALLGDPGAFVLDEPANGLDPEGIRWIRLLIRRLADEGRSVLVSSHVLSEIQQIADEVLIISRGELKYGGPLERLADPTGAPVVVDATDREQLRIALAAAGLDSETLRTGLTVRGSNAEQVGTVAANAGIVLTTLQQRGPTLEDAFIEIVQGTWVEPEAPHVDEADALFTDETFSEDATGEADVATETHVEDMPAAGEEVAADVELPEEFEVAAAAEAAAEAVEVAEDAVTSEDVADVADELAAELAQLDEATAEATEAVTEAEAEPAPETNEDVAEVVEDGADADAGAGADDVTTPEAEVGADDDTIVVEAVVEVEAQLEVEADVDESVQAATDETVAIELAPEAEEPQDAEFEAPAEAVAEETAEVAVADAAPIEVPRRSRRFFGRRTQDAPAPEAAAEIEVVIDEIVSGIVGDEPSIEASIETRTFVIESDPATAIIETPVGEIVFDDATVAIEIQSDVTAPTLDEAEQSAPGDLTFDLPNLWDNAATVSSTIIDVVPVVEEHDDADLDVIADELHPDEAPTFDEVSASSTRRSRRG